MADVGRASSSPALTAAVSVVPMPGQVRILTLCRSVSPLFGGSTAASSPITSSAIPGFDPDVPLAEMKCEYGRASKRLQAGLAVPPDPAGPMPSATTMP